VQSGRLFFLSMLHRKVTSEERLLPTPSGTSDSHTVPVRLRAAARVLIHEVVALLSSLGYPPDLSG
jgi:hypothetical protein